MLELQEIQLDNGRYMAVILDDNTPPNRTLGFIISVHG